MTRREHVAALRASGLTWAQCAAEVGCTYDQARESQRMKVTLGESDVSGGQRAVTSEPYAGAAKVAEPNTVMGRIRSTTPIVGEHKPGRYRVAHVTDIHFGSKHCDTKALLDFLELARAHDVCAIICTGDTLDGVSDKFIHEQREAGFEGQATEAVETFVAAKLRIPIVSITGNHDGYFRDVVGLDAGRALAERMQAAGVDWRPIGSCLGRAIVYGAKSELYHPHGGGATRNAVRRVLNAKAERYEVEDRPNILYGGHFHKHAVVHAYPEDILCVGGGTFQVRASDFGVRMIHPWDIGGGIVSWTIRSDGKCVEKAAEFFNVRPETKGWAA